MSVTAVRQNYFADQADHDEELSRLQRLEENRDQTTRRYLKALGIRKGWRCLEVGPGAGSIARWMAERVGPKGRVVAADINPRFLADNAIPNLDVRRHDIANDPIEVGAYDLVHARLVLMHIPEPMRALERMVAALRPGGRILVEDGDLLTIQVVSEHHPDAEVFTRVMRATHRHIEKTHTFDVNFGRRVPKLFEAMGLTDIDNEVTLRVAHGGDERFRSPFERYREGVLATGEITEEEWETRSRCFDDPDFSWIGLSFVATWGRKPG
jgi:SAM-dependent methyltransferase